MAQAGTELGPFVLTRVIGKGAMGVVWEAEHRYGGGSVAIKFLHAQSLQDDWALESFRKEVRAQAGLAHNGVVTVLDHGLVPRPAPGGLTPGAPFLVMELIDGIPLHTYTGRLPWARLRDVMLQLLDGLAHAHARGVIHRDLKPGNVLVLRNKAGKVPHPESRAPFRLKLTDFGLAQALDRSTESDGVVAGTPAYMAPEQLYGLWRDQGSWTDLYSVACMAWSLATGDPPFGRDLDVLGFRDAHLHQPPPPFTPAYPCPTGFEAWLRRMLTKRPNERFQGAAEAAFALISLDEQVAKETVQAIDLPTGREAPVTLTSFRLQAIPMDASVSQIDEDLVTRVLQEIEAQKAERANDPTPEPTLTAWPRMRPPMPVKWRHPRPPRRPDPMPGVGLNLFALRHIPLVGRERERDMLWAAMEQVHRTCRQRAVVITGQAGCGKSRLSRWLCERAEEVGAATVLKAFHNREGSASSGLVGMITRHLRLSGLEREEVRARLGRFGELADALTDLVRPHPGVRFASNRERNGLVLRLLERLARPPHEHQAGWPLLVLLDDVHWSTESLAFVEQVLSSARSVPVLFVLTVQDEAMGKLPRVRETLQSMRRQLQPLELAPMTHAEHRLLVDELLAMEETLAKAVADRTAGNPQFAMQLLGDWVARDLLESSPLGFRLVRGSRIDLPPDLKAVWRERIQEELHGQREGMEALELAAVLGDEVDLEEWKSVCRMAHVLPAVGLLGRLTQQRLLRTIEDGAAFQFGNAMLREALLLQARDLQRLSRWHRACAQMLQRRPDAGESESERLGRHLLLSGQVEVALQVLLKGARQAITRSLLDSARRQLAMRERAMAGTRVSPADPRWGEGWLARAWLLFVERSFEESEKWVSRAEKAAAYHKWQAVSARAARERSRFLRRAGKPDEAVTVLNTALDGARRLGDDELKASCQLGLAALLLTQGKLDQVDAHLDEAREAYAWEGQESGMADCDVYAGRGALLAGELSRAREMIGRALELYETARASWKVAECHNMLGEIARADRDLDAARTHYAQAAELLDSIGHPDPYVPRVNLGLVLAAQGRAEEARQVLEPNLEPIARGRSPQLAGSVHLGLLLPLAQLNDWKAWDWHFQEGLRVIDDTGFVDMENAHLAELAAVACVGRGDPNRARMIYRVAFEQWKALGRMDEAYDVRDKIVDLA